MDGWVAWSGGEQSCPTDLVIITDRRVGQSNHGSSKQLLPLMAPFVLHLVLTCSLFPSLDSWSRATESLPSWPVSSAQDNVVYWLDCKQTCFFSVFTFFRSLRGKYAVRNYYWSNNKCLMKSVGHLIQQFNIFMKKWYSYLKFMHSSSLTTLSWSGLRCGWSLSWLHQAQSQKTLWMGFIQG